MIHRMMKLNALLALVIFVPKIDALTITDSSHCRTLPSYIRDTCLTDMTNASRFEYKRISSKHECKTLDDSSLVRSCNESQASGRFYFAALRHLPGYQPAQVGGNEQPDAQGPATLIAGPEERMAVALEKMAFYAKFNFIVTVVGLSLAAAGLVVTIVQ